MPVPSGYSEVLHTPHHRWAVEAAWQLFADRAFEHRVLPDGRCDIILRFSSDGVTPVGPVTAIIAGASTRFHMVPIAAGTGYVGVRLRPDAGRSLLGTHLGATIGRVLVGAAAAAIVPGIAALCAPAQNSAELSDRLGRFVAAHCRDVVDPLTAGLLQTLHVTGGRLPIAEMAALHGVDVRTVRRRVGYATGLTPKRMAMIIQFHRALRLRVDQGLDVAAAAFEAGYADQAHMSRVFRAMGGFSPARLPQMVRPGLPF